MKTTPTLPDIQTEGDIKTLVDALCHKAANDTLLGPRYGAAARIHWPQYLTSQYRYWNSTLLGKQEEEGEPVPAQLALPSTGPHIEHWVNLFSTTVEECFAGSKADEAKQLARQLATRLQAARVRELPVD